MWVPLNIPELLNFLGKFFWSQIPWNPYKPDTVGPNSVFQYSKVSSPEGLCLFLPQRYLLVHSGLHLSECSRSMQVHTVSNAWIQLQHRNRVDRLKQTHTSLVSHTHTAQWSSNGCIHGQLKALSDVLSWPFIQVAVTLLRFVLLPVSYNTPSGKASLKSLGLSLSLLIGIGGQTESTLAVYAVMQ